MTVDILREKVLPDPLYETRLITRDRLRPFSPDPIIPDEHPTETTAEEQPGKAAASDSNEILTSYISINSIAFRNYRRERNTI